MIQDHVSNEIVPASNDLLLFYMVIYYIDSFEKHTWLEICGRSAESRRKECLKYSIFIDWNLYKIGKEI